MGFSGIDYELIDILERFRFLPSDEYVSSATVWSIVIGLIAASFIIFTAVTSKKNMALGITAGVMQVLGAVAAQQAAIQYWKCDFFKYEIVYGTSEGELIENLMEKYQEMILEMLPHMLLMYMYLAFMLAAWIVTLVYIIKTIKTEPKAFGIAALVVHIVRYAFVGPMNIFAPIFGITLTDSVHASYDAFVYIVYLIPALLIGALGIMNFIKSLINKNEPVTQQPAEAVFAPEVNTMTPADVSVDD